MQETKTRSRESALFPQRRHGDFRAVRERHLGADDDHVRDARQLQLRYRELDHLRRTTCCLYIYCKSGKVYLDCSEAAVALKDLNPIALVGLV